MLESFFVNDPSNIFGKSMDSFPIAVPMPSKRGPLASLTNNCNFNNIMSQNSIMITQKPSNYQKPSDEIKNLKTIIEDVKNTDNEMFVGELTKTQKEIVNLRNMENTKIVGEFSKVFSDEYNSIAPLLVNGNLEMLQEQCKVEFNPFLNYKEMVKYLQLKLSKNLSTLKEKCLHVNLLQNSIEKSEYQTLDLNSIAKTGDSLDNSLKYQIQASCCKERKIFKNSNAEGLFAWSCPFKNCDKAYSGRASLRMHIKHKHTFRDEIKKDYPYSLSSVFTPNFGRGVDISKVVKKRTKILKPLDSETNDVEKSSSSTRN